MKQGTIKGLLPKKNPPTEFGCRGIRRFGFDRRDYFLLPLWTAGRNLCQGNAPP